MPLTIVSRSDGEILTAAKYNTDRQTIADGLDPATIDDYSANTTEMRTQTDPGESGSESLPTTEAGEFERLRYRIAEISGMTYWYQTGSGIRAQNLATASLPAVATAGRLARRSDGVRGLVQDTSTQWVHVFGDIVNVKEYGATGNGTTDDTTALTTALTSTNKVVYLPPGTYKVSSTITPTCAAIIGAGEAATVIKPTAAMTKVLSIGAVGYPAVLRDFKVDCSLVTATSAVGIIFGDTGSCAVEASNIRVSSLSTTGSVGFRLGEVLKSSFTRLTSESCYLGMTVQGITGSFPTTCNLNSCVFTGSTINGVKVLTGYDIKFTNCDFESSVQEGFNIIPATSGTCTEIILDSCWFEANYNGQPTKYQFVADGSAAGSTVRPRLINCFWSDSGSNAKRINMTGAGTASFKIVNPSISSTLTAGITIDGSAYGEIIGWSEQYGYTDNVSDTGNKTVCTNGGWIAYTPTYASDVGNAATTFSGGTVTTNLARYKILGKTLCLNIHYSATLNAVTPNYISVTLPTNLTSQSNSMYTPASILNNSVDEIGLMRTDNGSLLFFYRPNFANYTSATALAGRISAVIEID